MWIFILEAMLAVGLLLGIVWWTLGPVQKSERQKIVENAVANKEKK